MRDDPTIAAFARDLQEAAAATPAPAVGGSLAAVLEGRAPASVYPDVPAAIAPRRARGRARLRWAAACAAFGLGAGSLGVAGALPGPVQRQVARLAEVVGLELPDGTRATAEIPSTPARPAEPPSTVVFPPTPAADRPPAPSAVPDGRPDIDDRRSRGRGIADDRRSSSSSVRRDEVQELEVEVDVDDERNGPSDAEDELGEGGDGTGASRGGPDDGDETDVEARRNSSSAPDVHNQD